MLRPFVVLFILGSCSGGKESADTDADDGDADADSDSDTDTDTESGESGGPGPGPDNNTIDLAEPLGDIPLETDVFLEAEIEVAGDRDFYVFDAVAGDLYQFYAVGASRDPLDPTQAAGEPDTVLRIYGADQVQVAENDDLSYRLGGTDSGIFTRPSASGQIYIEVLEYADWAGYPPVGGATFDYTLHIIHFPAAMELNEDVLGGNDVIENAYENSNDLDGDTFPEYSWYNSFWQEASPYAESPGTIDPAGDEDWLWTSRVEPAEEPLYCQFSEFLGDVSAAAPRYELWKERCNPDCDGLGAEQVASTDEPSFGFAFNFLYDAGITYVMDSSSMYYLKISDSAGGGGADHWYSAITVCYTNTLSLVESEDGETQVASGQPLAEDVAGDNFVRIVGWIDGVDIGGPDLADQFIIDWADAGDQIDVIVETVSQGSLLDDAEVTVFHEDSPGNFVEIGTGSGVDPSVLGLITPDANRIAVQIRSASGRQGAGQSYFGVIVAGPP